MHARVRKHGSRSRRRRLLGPCEPSLLKAVAKESISLTNGEKERATRQKKKKKKKKTRNKKHYNIKQHTETFHRRKSGERLELSTEEAHKWVVKKRANSSPHAPQDTWEVSIARDVHDSEMPPKFLDHESTTQTQHPLALP